MGVELIPMSFLVLAATAVVALSGCAVSVDLGDAEARVETTDVPAAGITRLEVATDNGEVSVVAGTGPDIVVESIVREHDAGDATADVQVDGDRLVLTGACDAGWFEQCSVGFRVELPASTDVAITTDNGAIDLASLTGDIDVTTENGRIDGRQLASDFARVRTDNGRIELAFTAAPRSVDARTENGRVVVSLPVVEAGYRLDAETGNGSTNVDVPTDPGAERSVHLVSDNGDITVAPA